MTAQELRIGNAVSYMTGINGSTARMGFIVGVDELYGYIKPGGNGLPIYIRIERLSGIPLTPELLEQYGFKADHSRDRIFEKGRLRLSLGDSKAIVYLIAEDTGESHYIPNAAGYLHQLMNLWYSLTGEELLPVESPKE